MRRLRRLRRFIRLLRKVMGLSRCRVIRSMRQLVGIRRSMDHRWGWEAAVVLCGERCRRLLGLRLVRLRLKASSR